MNDQTAVVTTLPERYQALSITLFGEALNQLSKALCSGPEAPVGQLVLTLERLVASLRQEPFQVLTESERRVRLRAAELLAVADSAVNGPDTTEGRAKLFILVSELKKG